jgi:hypothetical protein
MRFKGRVAPVLSKKKYGALSLVFIFLIGSTQASLQSASAAQFFTISGKVTQADGTPVKALQAQIFFGDAKVSDIDSNGFYSFLAAESNSSNEMVVSINNYPTPGPRNYLIPNSVGSANFTTRVRPDKNVTINFSLPVVIQIAFQITDAKSQPITNTALRILSSGGKFTSLGGIEWMGIVYPTGNDLVTSNNGQYSIWIYALPHYMQGQYSYNYSQMTVNLNSLTGRIPMDKTGNYKLCAPINLGESKSTPSDCYDEFKAQTNLTEAEKVAELKAKQETEAKAAAELKAKQEAEAKAAAELKAKQEAEAKAAAELKAKQEAEAKAAAELKAKQDAAAKASATKKKTTITCVKGKTTRKVTDVSPKCPSGFKLKK